MLAVLPFIFGNWLIAAIMSTVITVAFWMGISYLGGKLFAPDMPEADTGPTADAQSRSWNPHSTQREGIARPRAYGRNMHHGNIVAKWTDVVDNREVLYMVVEHGDGPTKGVIYVDNVSQVFLNDQPATNFTSVEIQERLGTFNQTCMTGFEKTKLEYPQNAKLVKDEPIIFTTHQDYFDDLEYTILFPNGLLKYQKDGDRKGSVCTIKVRIRVHPSGEWTEIFNAGISACSLEPYFKLYKVSDYFNVVRGTQYDLEFTNLTGPGERHVNDIYIKSIREVVNVAFTRPGKALVGIRAVATEALSGSIDVKVIREDRLVNVWNGTTWEIKYSRNRAWVVFDALTQPVISGDGNGGGPFTIEHYEGLNPSYLYLDFFYAWASFCSTQVPDGYGSTEDRIACDTILDYQTDVWTFANEVANVGRAYLYWQGHILTGWIDKEVTVGMSALVTMDNLMARSWKNQWTEKSELAGRVEVFFNDSRQGYERTPAPLPNESAGKYTRIISIEGVGITTRGTAIHLANHALKRNQLIRNVNSFRQYKDAFRYHLGDIINLQHKIPDWGESYRVIKSTATNKVTLDRICTAVATDLLFIQSYDETLKEVCIDSYTVASVSGKVVTIENTWDVTPQKNYMVAIGADGAIQTRRIIRIDPVVTNYFDVTVETYDTTLFSADDLVPDLPDQNYIWAKPASLLSKPATLAEVIAVVHSVMMPRSDVDTPETSNCNWNNNTPSSGYISWSKTDATESIVFRYKGTSYEITPDNTDEEFIYWDPAFTTTFRHTNNAAVAFALGKWIMCRNINGVAYPTIPIPLIHAGILQAGTITAELGQIANLTVGSAEIIDLAVVTAKIQNLHVTTGKLEDHAATRPGSAYTAGEIECPDNVETIVQTISGFVSKGGAISIWAKTGYVSSLHKIRIYRDTTQILEVPTGAAWGSGRVEYHQMSDTPGAGTYTYTIRIFVMNGEPHADVGYRSLIVHELTK